MVRLGFETAVWLALALGLWIYAGQFTADLEVYRYGPVAWPRAVFIMMIVCALIHFLHGFAAHRRAGGQVRTEDDADDRHEDEAANAGDVSWVKIRIASTFLLPLIYLWLLPRMGFFVTTPFFLAAYMVAFRDKDWRYIIGASIAIFVVITLVFSKLLFIPLPTGNWPVFYDISNAILGLLESI